MVNNEYLQTLAKQILKTPLAVPEPGPNGVIYFDSLTALKQAELAVLNERGKG